MDYSDYFILLIIIIVVYYFFRKEKDTNTNNSSSVDETSIEELYPNMSYGEIMSILSDKDESEMTDSEVFFYFGMTMYNEGVDGRSKAIEQLLNNNYTILEDEFGNQYKEVINFVLKYFEDNTEEVGTELARSFPIMHTYIDIFQNRRMTSRSRIISILKKLTMSSYIFAKIISLLFIQIKLNVIVKSICVLKKQLMG